MYIQLNVFNANDKCIATEEYEADTTYDFSTDLDKLIKRTKHGSYGKMSGPERLRSGPCPCPLDMSRGQGQGPAQHSNQRTESCNAKNSSIVPSKT